MSRTQTMRYAILGKLTAKPKIDGKRIKVRKKARMMRNGRTLWRSLAVAGIAMR